MTMDKEIYTDVFFGYIDYALNMIFNKEKGKYEPLPKKREMMVIMDCCYSGTVLDNEYVERERMNEEDTKKFEDIKERYEEIELEKYKWISPKMLDRNLLDMLEEMKDLGIIVLCAPRGYQYAYEIRNVEKKVMVRKLDDDKILAGNVQKEEMSTNYDIVSFDNQDHNLNCGDISSDFMDYASENANNEMRPINDTVEENERKQREKHTTLLEEKREFLLFTRSITQVLKQNKKNILSYFVFKRLIELEYGAYVNNYKHNGVNKKTSCNIFVSPNLHFKQLFTNNYLPPQMVPIIYSINDKVSLDICEYHSVKENSYFMFYVNEGNGKYPFKPVGGPVKPHQIASKETILLIPEELRNKEFFVIMTEGEEFLNFCQENLLIRDSGYEVSLEQIIVSTEEMQCTLEFTKKNFEIGPLDKDEILEIMKRYYWREYFLDFYKNNPIIPKLNKDDLTFTLTKISTDNKIFDIKSPISIGDNDTIRFY
eukprot:TRINITY_DN10188_c0_g1_i1.p1 TRINITY_DN10188_c0_g1~~TRINITY_DN10188_c0_g1_i1.p1  ORF type:complete len:483 (-),score=111.11 TRINITY_DN10188_c0_g1_i1:20-1468(-)